MKIKLMSFNVRTYAECDGINRFDFVNPSTGEILSLNPDILQYHTFRTNDQQGFYWCGEITIPADFTKEYFSTCLCEESIILLNFYKIFHSILL